jgi:hypothetical protein
MPTRAGVDGAAMPAVTPSLAPSHDAIPHQIAAEVAQRMARYETGGVPAALDDPTPLRAGDEQTDIMERLTDAILNPRKQADVHVPFSKGETIALGIIGGTSPEAFQNVVMPLIQGELQRGDKESENRQREQDRQIGALQALATLRESQSRDRQTALYQQAQMEDNRIRALAAAENAETARKKAEAAATAGKPVPAGLMASYERIAGGAKASEEVAKIMDDNYSLAGGYPGGPIAGHLPGGVRNVLYPKLALINDAILAHFMRRSQGNSDLARQYTEPYLLKLTTWGSRLRQQVNEAYDLLHATAKTDRISYPQALYKEGIMHETYDPDELEIAAGAQGGAVTHIAPPPPGSYVDPDFDEAVGE